MTRPTTVQFSTLVVSVFGFLASSAHTMAQPYEVRDEGHGFWSWEASLDNGATWHGGLVTAPQTQNSVRIRARVGWERLPNYGPTWFGEVRLDAYVRSIGGAGLADSTSNLLQFENEPFVLALPRFGEFLKLDSLSDAEPPGLGPGWWLARQAPPGIPEVNTRNPISVLTYQLHLDGSSGDRRIDQVNASDLPADRFIRLWVLDRNTSNAYIARPLMMYEALTLRVVPSPGMPIVMGFLTLVTTRRRR